MKVAKRGAIAPFEVMDVLRKANIHAANGADIIHLSLGQPGQEAPLKVRQKMADLLLSGKPMGYTDSRGLTALRTRIAQHYQETYGVSIDVDQVIVTVGGSGAFLTSLIAAFDVGDTVAIALPCYPAYPNMLESLGLNTAYMRATAATHYHPTVEMLQALPKKPDGLIIASPSNPTGTMIPEEEFKRIVAYCDANKIRLISDEIYHGITYNGAKCITAAALSDKAIITNSFSKYFLMPGWRLGWAILPKELQRSAECLLQNFYLSPPTLSQYAALEVFDCKDELEAVIRNYAQNRSILLEGLQKAGFTDIAESEGAFYLYANVSKLTNDSADFCDRMLTETGVAAVPGHDFDREQGGSFVRFSFAGDTARIAESVGRLQHWLK